MRGQRHRVLHRRQSDRLPIGPSRDGDGQNAKGKDGQGRGDGFGEKDQPEADSERRQRVQPVRSHAGHWRLADEGRDKEAADRDDRCLPPMASCHQPNGHGEALRTDDRCGPAGFADRARRVLEKPPKTADT